MIKHGSQVLCTINAIMEKGQTHYCKPSPDTMIGLLSRYHDTDISRRTYFNVTKQLIDEGYMSRRFRYKNTPDGQPHHLPSILALTFKGISYLVRYGVAYARKLYNKLLVHLGKKPKTFPKIQDVAPVRTEVVYTDYIPSLQFYT